MQPRARPLRVDRLLLAAASGALVAAGWSFATAADPVEPGQVVSATVLATAGCTAGGQDTVSVDAPGGAVTARLDACGQPTGQQVRVVLEPGGSVGAVVAVAGTRAAGGSPVAPALALGACGVAVVAAAWICARAGRRSIGRG